MASKRDPKPTSIIGEDVAAADTAVVSLGRYVSAMEVERCLQENAAQLASARMAQIDLSRAVHFDIVGLLRLLATAAGRHNSRQHTKFKLPSDAAARHILRLWQFPRAASVATLTPFRLLVDAGDWVYFGETWPKPRVIADAASPRASVLAYLVERSYFGLSPYSIHDTTGLSRVVENETAHWGSYALSNLLAKVLHGPAQDIARVIMQETLMNVLEHAGDPTVVVVGSQLDLVEHAETGALPGLTISVWDDGSSIVSTLKACVAAADTARVFDAAVVNEFEVEAVGWRAARRSYTSNWTPGRGSADAEILLASLFAGISRKASGAPESADSLSDAGYGLFALYRTAIDTFRGSVEIRSEQTTLYIDRPDPTARYRVRLVSGEDVLRMTGDIVTVRLPVHDA